MSKQSILKQDTEKIADINVKNDFFGDQIQEKIMEEAFKALPFIRDLNYKLQFTDEDKNGGNLIARIEILLPESKNKNGKVKLSVPIFIKDFKMKPIDTFVMNGVAFPVTDETIKELLISPENFRPITFKEMKETKILAKIAEDYTETYMEDLKKIASEDSEIGYFANIYLKGSEKYLSMIKKGDDFSEPILDCIMEMNPKMDFDVYYVKVASDNQLKFVKETVDANGAKLLMEGMGYNSEKLAKELINGKQMYMQSPITKMNDGVTTFPYNPQKVEKTKIFSNVPSGPVKAMDIAGKSIEGFNYDLFPFSGHLTNEVPSGKIFIDKNKNYFVTTELQAIPNEESSFVLSEDKVEPGTKGIFVDMNSGIAYGPIEIMSLFTKPGEPEVITAKINGRKYEITRTEMLKKYVPDGNKIMIPQTYTWINLNKKIKLFDKNQDKYLEEKIAEAAYTITKVADNFKITRFIGNKLNDMSVPVNVPSTNHLKLLLLRLNLLTSDLKKVIDEIEKGKPFSIATNFPLLQSLSNTVSSPAPEKGLTPVEDKPISIPETSASIVRIIKTNVNPLMNIFPGLFKLGQYENLCEQMDQFMEKEGSAADTLESIFSLNIVNDINSSVFLQNIDRLKFALSFLSALRLYMRYGWDVGLKEGDVSTAIDSLSNIIQNLNLVKTQNLLDKQMNMQNG